MPSSDSRQRAALAVYVKLMRAAESVTMRVHEELPPDLTVTQFGVLEALHHLGPLCQGQLASKLLKSGGNLTLVVSNLERDGLVLRTRSKTDQRFVSVDLTGEGRRLIARLFPRVAARIEKEFSIFSPEELAAFGHHAKRLGLHNATSAPGDATENL